MRSRLIFPGLLIGALGTFSPAAEVTGRVLSERKGVVGATVAALPYESPFSTALRETKGEPRPQPLATATSTADGRFRLLVPTSAAPFVVRISFGGLAARTLDGVFEKADAEDVGEISLGRGETISGRVVDPDGKPVAGAQVRMGRDGLLAATNREGFFRFEDIEGRSGQALPLSQLLSVDAPGFEVQAATARFSGAPATIRLKVSALRLSGGLREWSGKPATDAVVRVVGDAVTRWTRTDATGRFQIQGAPSKAARYQALGKDGTSMEAAVKEPASTTPFTLLRASGIEGRVTHIETGRVVAGAKVLARSGRTTIIARTGVDGRYRLPSLPQGSYRLRFDEKSFVLLDRRDVELEAGVTRTLDIALTPAVTLVGRVSDEKGQPLASARGTFSPGAESRMALMSRAMSPVTDGTAAFVSGVDGTFKATRLAPGTNQKLTVVHPEFERRVIPGVDLVPGALKPHTIDVVLSSGHSLSGLVKDKEGRPLTGAQVGLNRSVQMTAGGGGSAMSFNTVETVRPQTETDLEGRFVFKGLSAGDYDVTISKSGFTRNVSTGVKASVESTPLEVVLSPGASIAGRLIQTSGVPVTGFTVSARSGAPGQTAALMMVGRANTAAQTDPDGGFVIEGLTPGTAYDLSIFGEGEFRGDVKKKGVVAPATDIEIEVPSRGRIAGRALDAATGAPLTEFAARYTQARAGGMRIVTRVGADAERRTPFSSPDGSFAFEDVPPGNWDVTVWAKTYQEARTGGIAVAPGETKTVEVRAARGLVIRGRVVDAKGGRGVQDATVTVRDAGGAGPIAFDFGLFGGGVVTDAEGRFEIKDQAPGSFQLTARHPQFSEGTGRVALDDKDGAVEISLLGGGTIGGVVMSSQGGPLAGAEVSLQSNSDAGGPRFGMEGQTALTDGSGRFRFEHLAAGRYRVGAMLRAEASPFVDVPLNGGDVREDIRLALDAGATLRGVVTGLPENERVGVMVMAQGLEAYSANTRTRVDGSFEFAGVPKGTLTLRATAGEMAFGSSRTAIKEVSIPPGQTDIATEIVFDDGLSISGTVMRRGQPVVGARISAFMTGTGRQASARADETGAFKIIGLEAGRVNVMAFSETFTSQVSQIVELTADTSIDLVIPTAKVAGAVLDATGGLPLEASVELQRVLTTPGTGQPRLMALTDSSGRFAFEDLEPVDYRLTARRSGYESVTQPVKPTEAGEDLRIELKRGTGLSVEAKDAQMGFGLRSLFVRLQQGTTDVYSGSVPLDGDGRGEVPGIPAGSYSLVAQAPGYAPVRLQNVMAPSSTALRLAFSPGGTVEFKTTEEFLSGGPKSGQFVSMTGVPSGMGSAGPNSFRLSRLTQRMENLTPGRYRLTLEGGIDKTVDVTEGGVTVVAIP